MAENNLKESESFHNIEIPSWLLPTILAAFVVAALFFYSNRAGAGPVRPAFVVKPEYYDISPVRTVGKRLETEGVACGNCHSEPAGQDPRSAPEVHGKTVLRHGANNRCFNCHNNARRDFFTAHDGAQIPYSRVETLCAKCHGPTYRDWTRGAHGRRNGYWNKAMGAQKPLACIACHDPHNPAFKPMTAAPPPQKHQADRL